MAFFEWTDELSVGVEQMDLQHKKLIAIINEFHNAVSIDKSKDQSAVKKAVESLSDYVRTHFDDEEALMQKHNFPKLDFHIQIHERLAQKVNEYATKLQTGQKVMNLDMAIFLKGWLEDHIGQTDKMYGDFITGQQK